MFKTKHKDFELEMKSFDKETGTFTGYGSVFDVVDGGNDIIVKGAFSRSLSELEAKKRAVPILWQHDSREPIGHFSELKEDETGLLVSGVLDLEVQKGREAKSLMSKGIISGLSIGYGVKKSQIDQKSGIRTLTDLDLFEISLVTFPMNDSARISAIKERLREGAMPTQPQFERLLRDVGFSKKNATIIASCDAVKKILRSDSGSDEAKAQAVLHTLKDFKLPTF